MTAVYILISLLTIGLFIVYLNLQAQISEREKEISKLRRDLSNERMKHNHLSMEVSILEDQLEVIETANQKCFNGIMEYLGTSFEYIKAKDSKVIVTKKDKENEQE